MRIKLNFNYLESFLMVAKFKSFSLAAKSLGIAQPAISKQIQLLERDLGCELFVRTRKEAVLTKRGETFFLQMSEHFEQLGQRFELFIEEKSSQDEILKGVVNFHCLQEVGERIFIGLLSEFKKMYPKIDFNINFQKSFEIEESCRKGLVDIGILSSALAMENFRSFEIFEEEIILVANPERSSKSKKINLNDSFPIPIIAYRHGDPLVESFFKSLSKHKKNYPQYFPIIVNSHKAIGQLLLAHPYFGVLPRLSVEKELQDGQLVQVGEHSIHSRLYLVERVTSFPDKKLSTLKKFLREKLSAL